VDTYSPENWYWAVSGDQQEVYASARGIFVPISDATYVAWQDRGNHPTPIGSTSELAAILAPAFARPNDATLLNLHQTEQATNILSKAAFKVLFNHENRIRALEGKVAISVPQALTAIKALM
jgi:hypothetical protein